MFSEESCECEEVGYWKQVTCALAQSKSWWQLDWHCITGMRTVQRQVWFNHSVNGCTRGVQAKLWDPLRTRAIPERLRGVIMTRHHTTSTFTLPLPSTWTSAYNNRCCETVAKIQK